MDEQAGVKPRQEEATKIVKKEQRFKKGSSFSCSQVLSTFFAGM